MPDRELTSEETVVFKSERVMQRKMISALKIIGEEKTKPSLHDLCIHELAAIAAAQTRILIDQGREIKAWKLRIKALEVLARNAKDK